MISRVLLAMSGGVDSTACALLLQDQGYEVIGVTMKILNNDYRNPKEQKNIDTQIEESKELAKSLGIKHEVIDVSDKFKNIVVKNFIDEYKKGRTPNQCALCNPVLKWDECMKLMQKYNCDYFATGHYARIKNKDGRFYIKRAIDNDKDQSYVLWKLTQEQLSKTIFPLGEKHKTDIRKFLATKNINYNPQKRDSQGICFSQFQDYRTYLKRNSNTISKIKEGNFYDLQGNYLSKHRGYPFYCIGQRRGLNHSSNEPFYVKNIYPELNKVILSKKDEMLRDKFQIVNLNFQKTKYIEKNKNYLCKFDYSKLPILCNLKQEENTIKITLFEKVHSLSPGQSAVIYDSDEIIIGGIIDF
jgi:tRNA-specific 2-thiouridylase